MQNIHAVDEIQDGWQEVVIDVKIGNYNVKLVNFGSDY
jgi:hypothetical protein